MMIELSMIWAILIAVAVFLYVALDGFDLGVGILFPFAKDARERDQMQAAIAPVWDGNETWLVLGGGGLFAAFPKAYAALMPALYAPIILMLLALIFRGVAFEFRHHGRGLGAKWWTIAFSAGSMVAAIAQGFVLGGFIQGVALENGQFAGGPLDWLTPFSLLVAASLVAGYALLGATWLVFKTQGELFERARAWVKQLALFTALAMGAVSLATLGVDPRVTERWGLTMTSVDWPTFIKLAPLPILAAVICYLLWRGADQRRHFAPYLYAVGLFLIGYLGLAFSLWPYIVPFAMTPADAAAADNALSLMLWGAIPMLPIILGYTAYVYWIFRAKVDNDAAYH
ncbi:cytochrome d ubiquinol oxidase subunit II [Vitreimonas flagellata]|uniref:cytochrome d ubiquinol oxidase subunit II n=1 Tax=Vitreimonas flagellata TaxID=2560861 RepID=UPI001074F2CF